MSEENKNTAPLDSLKNEISAKLNNEHKKSVSWNSMIVTIVLGVLTVVSVGQMAASITIFKKLQAGDVQASTGAAQNNSLESLPDMVGGC